MPRQQRLDIRRGQVVTAGTVVEHAEPMLKLARAIERDVNVTVDEAEQLTRSLAFAAEVDPEDATAMRARDAMRRELQTLARELVSSLQFYQGQPDSLGISEIVIVGGTARLTGLAPELQRLVGVPVRVGDPLAGVGVGKKLKGDAPGPSHTVPIGLGMAI